MNKLIRSIAMLLAMVLPCGYLAAEDFSGEKGYVDFGNLTGVYGEPRVQINLGTAMLGFVAGAAQNDDPDIAELFKNLKSVRVLVYDIEKDADAALKTVDKVTRIFKKKVGKLSLASMKTAKKSAFMPR